jgi:thiol:disulfide interchange protein DsbC
MDRMRPALALALVFAAAGFGPLAAPVHAQDAQPKAAAPARASTPAKAAAPTSKATVPADVRARVVSKLDGAKPEDVGPSPIPGLYEVTMGGLIAYVSSDGKYLVSGNVYDLDTQVNLTASRRNAARAKALAAARDDQMIVFSPANAKMTVTVFTDIDCGYCRKFHNQIAEFNKAGIRVRYMMFPRSGPGTESWRKAEGVWCSADRRDALTRAKRGEEVKAKPCTGASAIQAQYAMGEDLGVEGTPAIFTQTGDYVGGFMTPDQLVKVSQQTEKSAATR